MGKLVLATSRKATLKVEEEDFSFSVHFEFPFMEDMLKNSSVMGKVAMGEEAQAGDIFTELRSYVTGWDDIDGDEVGKELPFTEDNAKLVLEVLSSLGKVEEIMSLMQGVTTKNLKTGAKQ